jgi:hypothetical protein
MTHDLNRLLVLAGRPPHRQKISELFKPKGEIKWINKRDDVWRSEFEVKDIPFTISFFNEPHQPGTWEVLFGVNVRVANEKKVNAMGNTGLNRTSSVQVFGFVINAISTFLREEQPECLWFSASHNVTKQGIYTSLANYLSSQSVSLGYYLESDEVPEDDEEDTEDETGSEDETGEAAKKEEAPKDLKTIFRFLRRD